MSVVKDMLGQRDLGDVPSDVPPSSFVHRFCGMTFYHQYEY